MTVRYMSRMEEADINANLRANLARLMEEHGMDGAAVARAAGVNRSAIYDILNGRSQSPRLSTIFALARAFNKTPSSLYGAQLDDRFKADLLEVASDLGKDDQERLLVLALALARPKLLPPK